MLATASKLGNLASLEAIFAAKLFMAVNLALTTLVLTFVNLFRH